MAPKGDSECVKVVVRCRPMNEKEINEQRQRIVDMDLTLGQVSPPKPHYYRCHRQPNQPV
eukprot:scaffold93137_cov30-Prasinocladus_malaysianus.AAC.2